MPDSSPFVKALKKEYKPLPSASIGQYAPSTPAPFSPQSAAASNPMLAPQFDTSYSPSSGGTSYQKKTPYDAGSAFNIGSSSFDSFGSAPTRRRSSNPISQTTYSDPLSFSDAGSSFQQPTPSVPYDSGSAFNTTTTTYQNPFQVSPAPFQFRSETSSPAVRPTEVTEITESAPSRNAYTGAAAQVPLAEQPNVAFDELGRGSINGVPLYTGDRVESLGENVAAIEAVAQPEVLAAEPVVEPVSVPEVKTPGILDTITENLAESRFGKFLGGMTTYDVSRGGEVMSGSGNPVFPSLAEKTKTPAYGESDIPVATPQAPATPAPVAQDATVNFPAGDLGLQNQFAAQGLMPDAQSTLPFDPTSAFNINPMEESAQQEPAFQAVGQQAPQVAEKYKGEFADRQLVGDLKGIIEKDGIEYGVVEGVPDENETIIKAGRGEFIEVSPERKAAYERLGKLARTSEAVEARVKENQSKWTQKQRDNFKETGNKNVSMTQKIANERAFAATAPRREYNRFVEEQKSKARSRNKQLEKNKKEEIRQIIFDYPYSQRGAARQAIEAKYANIERYNNEQDSNARSQALSLANAGMEDARAAANLQAQQDSAAASLSQRQIEAKNEQEYRMRPAKPSVMQQKLNAINNLPISQDEKNARIYGLVGGESYDYPGDGGTTPVVTPSATSEVDALSNYDETTKAKIENFRADKNLSLDEAIKQLKSARLI